MSVIGLWFECAVVNPLARLCRVVQYASVIYRSVSFFLCVSYHKDIELGRFYNLSFDTVSVLACKHHIVLWRVTGETSTRFSNSLSSYGTIELRLFVPLSLVKSKSNWFWSIIWYFISESIFHQISGNSWIENLMRLNSEKMSMPLKFAIQQRSTLPLL